MHLAFRKLKSTIGLLGDIASHRERNASSMLGMLRMLGMLCMLGVLGMLVCWRMLESRVEKGVCLVVLRNIGK